jgi:plastocyanin
LYAVPSGSVTLTLSNQDNIVPHNVSVSGLGTSATCQGPCTVSLSFLAPPRGNYTFICTLHPYMTGTLVVQ